jgi:NarL family two-component system response regulator LiaR
MANGYFCHMWKTTLLFGICLAGLFGLLKWLEYSFIIKDLKMETYLGIVGGIFTILGIWIGWKITHKRRLGFSEETESNNSIRQKDNQGKYDPQNEFNLSPREHEVLVLIAQGLSYQEIADQLFVSLSTVKTHASNIFSKLDVQRRTQAVMVAQKSGIIPPVKV